MRFLLRITSGIVGLAALLHVTAIKGAMAQVQRGITAAAKRVNRYDDLIKANNDTVASINADTVKLVEQRDDETTAYILTHEKGSAEIRQLEAEARMYFAKGTAVI